jgi:hypothetical protein
MTPSPTLPLQGEGVEKVRQAEGWIPGPMLRIVPE